jgi:hypothetical protein
MDRIKSRCGQTGSLSSPPEFVPELVVRLREAELQRQQHELTKRGQLLAVLPLRQSTLVHKRALVSLADIVRKANL